MRSARTSVGIILTLCLLALPMGATGQSSDEAPAGDNKTASPVHVRWNGVVQEDFSVPGEPVQSEGSLEYTGWRSTANADDPRVRGTHTIVMLGDGPAPPEAGGFGRFTSLVRIENDEGAWQGPVTDVFLPDDLWIQYGWLKGEGAYEGLSFFTSGQFDAGSPSHHGQGMICAGDPPPVPDPALLEAE